MSNHRPEPRPEASATSKPAKLNPLATLEQLAREYNTSPQQLAKAIERWELDPIDVTADGPRYLRCTIYRMAQLKARRHR